MTNTEVISILVTIIIGVVPPIMINRKKKYAISANLLESYSFRKRLDKINVTYTLKGKQCENAFVLKLIFRNYGKYDIDSSIIKKPISIKLPNELQWLDFAISDINNIPKSSLNRINDNELLLNWELLKSGEEINVETLIINKLDINESFTSMKIFEDLEFHFRISNISTIRKNYVKRTKSALFLLRFYLALFGTLLILQGIPGFLPSSYTARYKLQYSIQLNGDSTLTYHV